MEASSPDRFLNIARSMNSDLGKHIKNNSFSVHLAGRFYENNSMGKKEAKQRKLARMKEKRKQLLQEIKEEEEIIGKLEEKLRLRDLARREALMKRRIAERGVMQLQSHVRRQRMQKRYSQMKIERDALEQIAMFLQRRYRGFKGRRRAFARADELWEETMQAASVIVQSQMRSFLAKLLLEKLKSDLINLHNSSAISIQKQFRGFLARTLFEKKLADAIEKRRRNAVTTIQAVVRGNIARYEVAQMKLKQKEKKPTRKKKVRKPSIRGDGTRRTFVVPAASKRQSNDNCWSLVRASVWKGDNTSRRATMDVAPRSRRNSLVGKQTMRASMRKSTQGSDGANTLVHHTPSEQEAVMVKRLSNASQAAIERHKLEATKASMKRRLRDDKSTFSQEDDETEHSSSVANSSIPRRPTAKELSMMRRISDAKEAAVRRHELERKAGVIHDPDMDNLSSSQYDDETVQSESSQHELNVSKENKIPKHIFSGDSSVISKVTVTSDCSFNGSAIIETVESPLDQIEETSRHIVSLGEVKSSTDDNISCIGSNAGNVLDKRKDSMCTVTNSEDSLLAGFAIIEAMENSSQKSIASALNEQEQAPPRSQVDSDGTQNIVVASHGASDDSDTKITQETDLAVSANAFDDAEFDEEFDEDMNDLCFS